MKKVVFYPLLFLISINLALGLNITKDIPTFTNSGKDITVKISVIDANIGAKISVIELLPINFEISDWVVIGATEAQAQILTKNNNVYNWSFTPSEASPEITYTVPISPASNGEFTFVSKWSSATESGNLEKKLNVISILCGNSICDEGEDETICSADCQPVEEVSESVFEKKKKRNPYVQVLIIAVILGLAGFVIYKIREIKKTKGVKLEIKIPESLKPEKPKNVIKQDPNPEKTEVEGFGSELPSFHDETASLELPSLEDYQKDIKEEMPDIKPAETPKEKHSKLNYKKKVKDVGNLFSRAFKKEK
ncbi:hypothetical protein HQ529_00905 [Candidatus Woesearchaeota archaeon]|nr:hypothetical protein [Candidatus Woesearchaeota archaeon]